MNIHVEAKVFSEPTFKMTPAAGQLCSARLGGGYVKVTSLCFPIRCSFSSVRVRSRRKPGRKCGRDRCAGDERFTPVRVRRSNDQHPSLPITIHVQEFRCPFQ